MKKGDIDELELIWDNYSFTPFLRTVLNEELKITDKKLKKTYGGAETRFDNAVLDAFGGDQVSKLEEDVEY